MGTDRDSLIERSMNGPFALPRDRAEWVADLSIAFNDGLVIGPTKGITTAQEAGIVVNKAVNSELMHAAGRAVDRNFFGTVKEAADALRSLSRDITKNGLPEGNNR